MAIILNNCSKPKTVFICGDHACINKTEAEQYFEENLSIEVKVLDKKVKKDIDLVELNLKNNENGKREISLLSKKDKVRNLKKLSNKEIVEIKKNIKNKKKKKKIVKKISKQNIQLEGKGTLVSKKINKNQIKIQNDKIFENLVNKKNKDVVDVCTILKKCSIDEISKYLLKQGKKKGFPDITKK